MATKKQTKETLHHEDIHGSTRLYRSETNRVIGGVAGGIGNYANIDPTLIRLIFILLTIFGGSGFLVYLVLWIIVPTESQVDGNGDYIRKNIEEMKGRARHFSSSMRITSENPRRSGWAIFFIVLGLIIIFNNFGFYHIALGKLWPLFLILLGILLLRRR